MSGLINRSDDNSSGPVGNAVDFQRFTNTSGTASSGKSGGLHNYTWTKPANVTIVYMEVIGAGAGGGGCIANAGAASGAGGGGGAYNWGIYPAANLPASLSVAVGAGGSTADANSAIGGRVGGTLYGTIGQYSQVSGGSGSTYFNLKSGGGGGGGSGNTAGGGAGGGGGGTSGIAAGGGFSNGAYHPQ